MEAIDLYLPFSLENARFACMSVKTEVAVSKGILSMSFNSVILVICTDH